MTQRVWRDAAVWLLTVGLVAITWALWSTDPALPHLQPHLSWWLLIPLFAVGERLSVVIPIGEDAHALSFTEIPLVLALLFSTTGETLVSRAVGVAIVFVLVRRNSVIKLAFNLASYSAQAMVAIVIFAQLVHGHDPIGPVGWLAAALAVMAAETVGTAAITAVFAINGQRQPGRFAVSYAIALGTA